MKRLILILLTAVFTIGVFSGCAFRREKEGQIVFALEEVPA